MVSSRSLTIAVVGCGDNFCQNGSICKEGPPNFDDHQLFDASFLDFHKQKMTESAFHCECPPRYTGIDCTIPYQACGLSGHKCYFGGECPLGIEEILGAEDLFCDCSLAVDSLGSRSRYVGKYCENPLVNSEDEDSNAKSYPSAINSQECQIGQTQDHYFCLSDGICNPEYPAASKQPCTCPIGFTGPYCEYKESIDPDCKKPCQNNGVCKLGLPDPASNKMADDIDNQLMYCDCPEGFYGDLCQVPSIPCGGKVCLNDARCIEWGKFSSCSCSHVKEDTFAGEHCEYKATTYCSEEASDHFEGGNFFCTNGGHCREEAWLGCECPIGYNGFSCEYYTGGLNAAAAEQQEKGEKSAPEEPYNISIPFCDLDCHGHGTCAVGTKDLDYLGAASHAKHLNMTHTENFQYCVCQNGFTGLQCEHDVALCGEIDVDKKGNNNEPHFCLHGSECVQNGDTGKFSCDCSSATSNISLAFAGQYCEHPATSFCSVQVNGSVSFCVNDGQCVADDGSSTKDICECTEGWGGRHCEIRVSLSREELSRDMDFASLFFLVTGVFLFFVALAGWVRHEHRQQDNQNSSCTDCNFLRNRRRKQRQDPHLMSFHSSTRPTFVMWPSSTWPSSRELYFGRSPSGYDSGRNLSPLKDHKESMTLAYPHDNNDVYMPAIQSSTRPYFPMTSPKSNRNEEDSIHFYFPSRDEDGNMLSDIQIT